VILDVAVCLPQEAQTVGLIRAVVRQGLQALGATQECVDDICLALSEACTNVIDHAVADDEYVVRLQADEDRCVLSVKNTGPGFDAGSLSDTLPDPSSARGRGVAIMHAVMDQVAFGSEPEAGTILHLVKTLSFEPGSLFDRSRPGPIR
jgi:serine/threonine-protein kinase RsbW